MDSLREEGCGGGLVGDERREEPAAERAAQHAAETLLSNPVIEDVVSVKVQGQGGHGGGGCGCGGHGKAHGHKPAPANGSYNFV